MNNSDILNIPDIIKVGFQNRKGTYTGKLAYVSYINSKNEIAKQYSWEGWIDKSIEPIELKNEPIEGFVLNKKVGGERSGWNYRNTYTRVYDPRGFEFEITVDNLIFILEECVSNKGKGLEGKFVYSWSGKDLVLLPVSSIDYKNSIDFKNKKEKITAKNLEIGSSYNVKGYDNPIIYIGRHKWRSYVYTSFKFSNLIQKVYLFFDEANNNVIGIKNLNKIGYKVSRNLLTDVELSDIIDKFNNTFHGNTETIVDVFSKKIETNDTVSIYRDFTFIDEDKNINTYTIYTNPSVDDIFFDDKIGVKINDFIKKSDELNEFISRERKVKFDNLEHEFICSSELTYYSVYEKNFTKCANTELNKFVIENYGVYDYVMVGVTENGLEVIVDLCYDFNKNLTQKI